MEQQVKLTYTNDKAMNYKNGGNEGNVIKDINIDRNLIISKDNETMYIYNDKIYKNNTISTQE